jgi:hypothetical protein
MRWSTLMLGVAVLLLLMADALAFHDLFEPHTVRDWMMLAGSLLAVAGLVSLSVDRLRTPSRGA